MRKITDNEKVSLHDKSLSDSSNERWINSDKYVYDFDRIKGQLLSDFNLLPKSPVGITSVDAIYINKLGNYVQIEMKDGKVHPQKIAMKLYDTVCLLDIVGIRKIQDSKDNDTFILIYKDASNKETVDKEISKLNNKNSWAYKNEGSIGEIDIQDQPLNNMKNKLAQRGNFYYTFFGLSKFEGFLFKKVYTLTKEQYEILEDKLLDPDIC